MELLDDQQASSIAAAEAMNDYRLIRHSKTYRRLSPKDTRMYHFRSVRKLTEFLKAGEPARSIVVTHHAPSIRSIAVRYKSDPVSAEFAGMSKGVGWMYHFKPFWFQSYRKMFLAQKINSLAG